MNLGVLQNNEILMPINRQILRANADGGGVTFDIRRKEIFESLQMMRKLGIEDNLKFWNHSFLCKTENLVIDETIGTWEVSAVGDYWFFARDYGLDNGLPIGEYTDYDSTGSYNYVGRSIPGGVGGALNHLYIEVPDNVGVIANNVASFVAYLTANPITVFDFKLAPKVYDISTAVNDSLGTATIENKRLRFNLGARIETPYKISTAASAKFAIVFWFKVITHRIGFLCNQTISETSAGRLLITESSLGGGNVRFRLDSSFIDAGISLNIWYMATFQRGDANALSVYINNNLIGTATQSAAINDRTIQWGGTNRQTDRNTDSEIDDMRVYDTDLTADQITEIYNQTKRNYE